MSRNARHRKPRTKQGLALAGVATLTALSCGGVVGAAAADPGHSASSSSKSQGQGKSQSAHAKSQEKGKAQDKGKSQGTQGKSQAKGKSHGKPAGASQGASHAQGSGATSGKAVGKGTGKNQGAHNPPGNNGTVKIAGPSDAVGQPSNNPHPGCTFYVEWFGYDEGADVQSTVTFTPQAPTSDVTISGDEPSTVFVGGDEAGGGTDLDGRQAYTLSFSGGAPHPKQGYHVKLTVATPHSLGNDTKTKVFWVAPCTDTTDTTGSTEGDTSGDTAGTTSGDTTGTTSGDTTGTTSGDTTGTTSGDTTEQAVGGTVLSAGSGSSDTSGTTSSGVAGESARTGANGAAVPTAVDAGESAIPEWVRSPLPIALVGGGVVLTAAAVARRNRARA